MIRWLAALVLILGPLGATAEEIEIRGATSIRIGDYTIRLDGHTTAFVDTETHVIRFGKPTPPDDPDPDPDPDPGPESLAGVAFEALGGLPVNQRIAIADVFGQMKIGVGLEVVNEAELGALTTERLRTALGRNVENARPMIESVFEAANRLRDAGAISTIEDWAAAWAAIAKGVRP